MWLMNDDNVYDFITIKDVLNVVNVGRYISTLWVIQNFGIFFFECSFQ